MDQEHGDGSVTLSRDGWSAVMAALEGDQTRRDDAFDALQRWAPRQWLEALDEQQEHARATHQAAETRSNDFSVHPPGSTDTGGVNQ